MKPYVKRVLSLLTALMLLGALSVPAHAEAPAEDLPSALDAFIAEHADTTAGLAVCVVDREAVSYENYVGYADREDGIPVTADTVFEWGSASKLLVWVSVMQLWEQGLVDLDADIRIYLPEGFLHNLRYDKPVTMRDLMNHRAGFQEMIPEIFLPAGRPIPSLEQALRRHEPTQVYEPDTVTAYSNWGTALAGYIVQRVSGQDYCDYVHEHIFAPLGMAHTALAPDLHDNPWVQEQRTSLQCYTADGELIPDCVCTIPLYPAGMVTGTLEDFAAFARALLRRDCPLFTAPETAETLFAPSFVYPGTDIPANCHGFWMIPYGIPVYGHGGNTAGCSANLLLDREGGRALTIMTNQQYESVYNEDLPELVFGPYEADESRSLPKGFYRTSRTVLQGPLKLYSAGYTMFDGKDLQEFWIPDGPDARQVYSPYGALLKLPTLTVITELALLLGWALAELFSLGILAAWPLAALRRRRCGPVAKADPRRPLRRCGALVLQASCALLVYAVTFLFRYAPLPSYHWVFVLCLLMAVGIPVLCILFLRRPRAETRGARALDVLSLCSLAALELNLLYWQLYAFWAL